MCKIKFPRKSEAPWEAIYPHHWVMLIASSSCIVAYETWNRQITNLFQGLTVLEHQRPRHRHLLQQIELWFKLVGEKPKVETCNEHLVRMWFHIIEQILEVMLMSGIKLAGSFSTATAKFNASCLQNWQTGDNLDYYKSIQEAKEQKDSAVHAPAPSGAKNSFRRVTQL